MTRINWFCFILFSVLFTSQQIVAAIDLARLYGHEGHDVQKRSGKYPQLYYVFIEFIRGKWLGVNISGHGQTVLDVGTGIESETRNLIQHCIKVTVINWIFKFDEIFLNRISFLVDCETQTILVNSQHTRSDDTRMKPFTNTSLPLKAYASKKGAFERFMLCTMRCEWLLGLFKCDGNLKSSNLDSYRSRFASLYFIISGENVGYLGHA